MTDLSCIEKTTTEGKEDLIRRISLLKRNAMAAPFEKAFDEFAVLQEEAAKYTRESAPEGLAEGGEVMAIHYRDEEAIYIKASHDRVTVIFSTIFREETDRIFGKVFLQVSKSLTGPFMDKRLIRLRNLLMLEEEPFRTHLKFSTATNRRWSSRMYVVSPTQIKEKSAMLPLVSQSIDNSLYLLIS